MFELMLPIVSVVLPVTWLVLDRQDLGLLPSSGPSTGLGAASRAVESCEDFSGSLHLRECRPFSLDGQGTIQQTWGLAR